MDYSVINSIPLMISLCISILYMQLDYVIKYMAYTMHRLEVTLAELDLEYNLCHFDD